MYWHYLQESRPKLKDEKSEKQQKQVASKPMTLNVAANINNTDYYDIQIKKFNHIKHGKYKNKLVWK